MQCEGFSQRVTGLVGEGFLRLKTSGVPAFAFSAHPPPEVPEGLSSPLLSKDVNGSQTLDAHICDLRYGHFALCSLSQLHLFLLLPGPKEVALP